MGGSRVKINILKDVALNLFSNNKYNLSYIIESANWVIKCDGKYITKNLNKLNPIRARLTTTYRGIRNQIIHFGSVNTFLRENGFRKPHNSNKIVLTWFHIVPEDKRNKNIIEAQGYLNFIHTSCNITKNNLVNMGVEPEKIIVIPLGVDLSLFKPASVEEKQKMKEILGIPLDKVIIGSFQKDGAGWDEGLEPKLIKGPDIFVKVVEQLAEKYPLYVLLIGPARGYVKNELRKRNIPFKSIGYLKNFSDVAKYYHALDLYLITSRIEGGPKAILEAWASGVPIVSTKVGMVEDISNNYYNITLVKTENIRQFIESSKQIIEDKNLRRKLIKNGLKTVQDYDWSKITERYYKEIYSKLL